MKKSDPGMTRFRILNADRNVVFKAHTTKQCYEFLLKQDMGLHVFDVEDIKDDIEIDADEFMQAFRDGERPEDLQFF